jgi:hypothetical protein
MKLKPAPIFTKKFKKASEVLQAARQLIRDIHRWTTGDLAIRTDFQGRKSSCSTRAKNAEAFCALGAVRRVDGPAQRSATAFLREAALRIQQSYGREIHTTKAVDDNIFAVNDTSVYGGHKTVLRMFTNAIRQARRTGN